METTFYLRGDSLFMKRGDDEALEASINKWKFIVKCLEEGKVVFERGGTTCALCLEHDFCSGCPVAKAVGVTQCVNTPYLDYKGGNGDRLKAAKAEVKFLESLR